MTLRIAELRADQSLRASDAAVTKRVGRIATAGFDTLLFNGDGPVGSLASIGRACASHALTFWATVVPDDAGQPLFAAQATAPVLPWMVDSEEALDPRKAPAARRRGPVVATPELEDAWRAAIEAALGAGVTGFVVRDAERMPASFWEYVIGHPVFMQRSLRFIAWTPGMAARRVAALVDEGFDGVCSSFAWWDGMSPWLIDERMRHPGVQQLAFAIDPFADVDDQRRIDEADRQWTTARLWLSALFGDAWLVPATVLANDTMHETLVAINGWIGDAIQGGDVRALSGPASPVTVLARIDAGDIRVASSAWIALVNPDAKRRGAIDGVVITTALSGFGRYRLVHGAGLDDEEPTPFGPCALPTLGPHEVRIYEAQRLDEVLLPVAAEMDRALALPRIAIEAVTPSVDDGAFPVKRIAGERVRVEADLIIDGHEKLAAVVAWRAIGDATWNEVAMEPVGNDRFFASFPIERVGRHEFVIEAWRDAFATYRNEIEKKATAGLDVSLEIFEGRLHVGDALAHARRRDDAALVKRLEALCAALGTSKEVEKLGPEARAAAVAALLASQTLADMRAADARTFALRSHPYPLDAERSGAGFASWYELFPRSQGNVIGGPLRHGTFDDVIARLPAVREMGFDVLYFPPIHPIGTRNRKGRNNSLTALADDPGSPYAIGSAEGGHDALHPELGTFDDFRRLREAALANGLELALDFAIQCSPDHPWLTDHPGWFAWRPDGSLRYAENPPKKYEDIVNVDFYGGDDAPALWIALRDVILLWVEHGVKLFRVDNPHTKPLPFWQWMIGEVRAQHPDVVFLSEAFTRPKVMYRLAKVGFSQSYTYFTWRHTKQEFIDYLTKLTTTAPRDFFRPHFFVNTPDINPVFLQRSGRPGFLIRAALAATLSGLWGVYSGFELCEGTPVPGKEDYLDSEKYEIRAWDWRRPGNIIAEITALNRIRRQNPALHTHLNIRFHDVADPNILYFMKATDDRSNIVLVAINLDPHGVHEADFELPLWTWGLTDDATVDVTDLLDDRRFRWTGKTQRMRLDPASNPYALWRVTL